MADKTKSRGEKIAKVVFCFIGLAGIIWILGAWFLNSGL